MQVQATIYYKILPTHPDKDCVVGGWDPDKEYNFTDTYTIITTDNKEAIKEFVKHDLALVAGGGYSTRHIKDVRYKWRWIE